MKRNTALRFALLATPLVAFLLYAALNWFRIVEEKSWVAMGPEARRDPFLAYSRLLAKTDTRATLAKLSARPEAFPAGGVVVLGAGRLAYMTAGRIEGLAGWVRGGGTLVVEAEPPRIDDPLLAAFGVEREARDAEREFPRKMPPPRPSSTVADFDWLGTGEPLRIDFGWRSQGLVPPVQHDDLQVAASAGRILALAFPAGKGRLVVLSSFDFLRSGAIGRHDHAELGWQLASHGAARGGALLYLHRVDLSLADWLAAEAWPVLVAAGLLVVLWLARIVPRFGPLAPEAPPVRRRIVEHIAASGRFLWSRGASALLLEAARERAWRAAARRFARLEPLPAPATLDKVADAAGVSRAKARRALAYPAATEAGFVDAMKAIQEIDTGLGRTARTLSTKGRT